MCQTMKCFPDQLMLTPFRPPTSASNVFDECFTKMTPVFFIFNINLNVNHCHVCKGNVFRDSRGVPEDFFL